MNLADVLDRATDEVAASGLAATAWGEAQARRRRRRVVLGAAAAALVVVGASAGLATLRDDSPPRPVGPSTPSISPSDGVPADDPVGRRWDPLTLVDDPVRRSVLPARLDPPEQPPNVADAPMEAAVLAWPEVGQDLKLLGTDGGWRCVKGTADDVDGTIGRLLRPALTHDGTKVAVATNDGVLVVDVATGDERLVPWPAPLAGPGDDPPSLRWLPGDDGLLVLHWKDTWVMELDGSFRKASYGGRYGSGLAVDPAGTVVERRTELDDLRVWRGEDLVSTAPTSYQWGERYAAGFGLVALTGGGGRLPGDGGPIVLDATTGDVLAYHPIRDRHAVYTDGGRLTAKGFLDAETVLLLVGPTRWVDRTAIADEYVLVAWSFRTGSFERLASGGPGMAAIDVAVGPLADG